MAEKPEFIRRRIVRERDKNGSKGDGWRFGTEMLTLHRFCDNLRQLGKKYMFQRGR